VLSFHPKIYTIDGKTPVIHPHAFVHPDAVLIGDVTVEEGCYIGPLASLRGDFGRIVVRQGSNVQDNCTLHTGPGADLIIEANGHIGHGAVVHGAHLSANVLIGMNSVVMDHVRIGDSVIVGAMSFVRSGAEIPADHLATGIPARVIRALTADELTAKVAGTRAYHELARRCLASFTS
jgi:phenylacetic acid degradation protein